MERVRYSVYRVSDDMPIIINGTVKECARALGITTASFRAHASRQANGKGTGGQSKYESVRDEE